MNEIADSVLHEQGRCPGEVFVQNVLFAYVVQFLIVQIEDGRGRRLDSPPIIPNQHPAQGKNLSVGFGGTGNKFTFYPSLGTIGAELILYATFKLAGIPIVAVLPSGQ